MRRGILVLCGLVCLNTAFAQSTYNVRTPQMQSGRVNLSALPDISTAAGQHAASQNSIAQFTPPLSAKAAMPAHSASAAISSFNTLTTPSPATSFPAQTMVYDIPPYPTGAVSANYVMSASSDQIVIQDRVGNVLKQVTLNDFWSAFGSDIDPAWDPNVRYDPYADRFILVDMGAYSYAGSSLLVAVSATGDPTGSWYLHRILADSGTTFDFPCVGFNKTWMVVTGIEVEDPIPNNYLYSVVYTFNIADLYAGGSNAPVEFKDITSDFVLYPALTYDPTVSTMYLLSDYSGSNGSLSLSTITGSADTPVLSLNIAYPSASTPWASTPPERNFAPQLGSTTNIDVFDARLGPVVYRNGSLWTAHTVFLPASAPTMSAIDWWQIGTDGTVQQFGRLQDPGGTYFYTYPSLSVNANSDMLLGYSRMSLGTYASGGYAFRAAYDPPATLRQEYVMPSGQGGGEDAYVNLDINGVNRWGEYSATQVDPVNDTDFWTVQEYAGAHNAAGSTWGMWWDRVIDPPYTAPTPASLSANPSSIIGTLSSTGTVTLTWAASSSGITVNLSSDNAAVQLPSTVTVPGGANSANFAISTSTVATATQANISASYNGRTVSTQLTVLPPQLTFSDGTSSVSISRGQSKDVMLNLASINYAGTVSFTVTSNSPAVTANAPSVQVTAGQPASSTLTISVANQASSHPSQLPWKSGGMIVCALLLGAPVTLRRKQLLALLTFAVAAAVLLLTISCGSTSTPAPTPQTATITVTPNPSPGATPSLSAVIITVNYQ